MRAEADVNGVRLGVAPRLNTDTRDYKILMDVSGDSLDYAIEPARLRVAARSLVAAFGPVAEPDCVIGLAPGGIALAVSIALEMDLRAVIAYKTRIGLDGEVSFAEPHSTHPTFYLYGVGAGARVVVVDDEADSGATLVGCVGALHEVGAEVLVVGTAVEGLHGGRSCGREELARVGVELTSLARVELDQEGTGEIVDALGAREASSTPP